MSPSVATTEPTINLHLLQLNTVSIPELDLPMPKQSNTILTSGTRLSKPHPTKFTIVYYLKIKDIFRGQSLKKKKTTSIRTVYSLALRFFSINNFN